MQESADGIARRHARELRAAVTAGGALTVLGGILAATDGALGAGVLEPVWSAILAVAGAALGLHAARAPRPAVTSVLKRDLTLAGLALVAGGVAELLHALGVARPALFHLLLAASLGSMGGLLATVYGDVSSRDELRVIHAVRVTGALFVLAALIRVFLVSVGDVHGPPGGVSMVLLSLAGLALVRTAQLTSVSAWKQL